MHRNTLIHNWTRFQYQNALHQLHNEIYFNEKASRINIFHLLSRWVVAMAMWLWKFSRKIVGAENCVVMHRKISSA